MGFPANAWVAVLPVGFGRGSATTGEGSVTIVMFFDSAVGRRPSVPIESFGRSRFGGVGRLGVAAEAETEAEAKEGEVVALELKEGEPKGRVLMSVLALLVLVLAFTFEFKLELELGFGFEFGS